MGAITVYHQCQLPSPLPWYSFQNYYIRLLLLEIAKTRITRYVFLSLIVMFGFFTLGGPFLPYKLMKLYTVLGLITNFVIVVSAFKAISNGLQSAKYFMMSCGALIVGVFFYGFQKLGYFEPTFLITNCIEIAGVLQAVGFAIAQTDKLNLINRQIRAAQKQALDAQIETNRVTEMMKNQLEELVHERTRDLWQKNQDIKVMMDNIQQGIAVLDGKMIISGNTPII